MSTGVGGWDKAIHGERELKKGRSVGPWEMGAVGRNTPTGICSRARGINLLEQGKKFASSLPGFLAGMACSLSGGAFWS